MYAVSHDINSCDKSQILQAILKQNELLTQLLTGAPAPLKRQSVPVKRLTLKKHLKQDFKTAFYKKWGIES